MFKRHYAVRNKAKLFELFDQGKRPSDIADAPVSRRTLYQYYYEWRKERGIEGKKTGFAVKSFDRKAYLEAKRQEALRKEREELERAKERLRSWLTDYEIVLSELKRWAEDLGERESPPPKIYLPTKRAHRWLSHLLRYRTGEPGPLKEWRERLPIIERNIAWLEKWVKIANKARSLSEFKEICVKETGGYPPEVEDY